MTESVVYMRGNFPFGFERPISAELVADAKLTLAVEPDTLRAIAAELESHKGFLDWDTLQGVIVNNIRTSQPHTAGEPATNRTMAGGWPST